MINNLNLSYVYIRVFLFRFLPIFVHILALIGEKKKVQSIVLVNITFWHSHPHHHKLKNKIHSISLFL